jgi:hypothetical protein
MYVRYIQPRVPLAWIQARRVTVPAEAPKADRRADAFPGDQAVASQDEICSHLA